MTPEEKLLALIQQDKRQADSGAKPVAPAPVAVAPAPAVAPPVQPAPAPAQAPSKPLTAPAAAPVQPAPAVPESPKAGPAQAVPAPSEKKLKLVEPKTEPPATAPASVEVKGGKGGIPSPKSEVREPQAETRESITESPVMTGAISVAPVSPRPVDSAAMAIPAFRSGGGAGVLLLNRILGVVVLVLVGVVFYSVASIRPGIAKALERQISGAGSMSVAPAVIASEGAMTVDAYLDKVSTRNIFIAKAKEQEGVVAAKAEPAGAPKELKLIAVSMDSASPGESMAIIKSKSDSKTYFVKTGQTVGDTDYVLDRVQADRVVLKLRKQEFELK